MATSWGGGTKLKTPMQKRFKALVKWKDLSSTAMATSCGKGTTTKSTDSTSDTCNNFIGLGGPNRCFGVVLKRKWHGGSNLERWWSQVVQNVFKNQKIEIQGCILEHLGNLQGPPGRPWTALGPVWTAAWSLKASFLNNICRKMWCVYFDASLQRNR